MKLNFLFLTNLRSKGKGYFNFDLKMYSSVPPPDQRTSAGVPEVPPGQRTSAGVSEEKGTNESLSQPANISQEQWEVAA